MQQTSHLEKQEKSVNLFACYKLAAAFVLFNNKREMLIHRKAFIKVNYLYNVVERSEMK
jgi:hypothetical protein